MSRRVARVCGAALLCGTVLVAWAAAPAPAPVIALKPPDPASISLAVLPAGPNRSLVVERCAVCHPIEQVVAQKRTADDWQRQVPRMVGFGAVATEDEQDLILDYLETVFGK